MRSCWRVVVAVSLGSLGGCAPEEGQKGGDGAGAGTWTPGDTAVPAAGALEAPAAVDFGEVELGDVAAAQLTVRNPGAEPLTLAGAALDGAGLRWVEAPPERLGGGEEVVVQIEWAPTSREPLVGALVWPGGLGAVPLEGQPVGAELRIDPDPVAVADGPLGCPRLAALRVVNDGQRPLEVHGLSTAPEGLSVVLPESAGPLPWTLMPGDDVHVELQYTAEVDAPFTGVLTVASSDPLAPELAAAVGGAAPAGDDAVDRFVQPSAVERDLLLSLDRSCSMFEVISDTIQEIYDLRQALEDSGADYRLAVTVDDDGCIAGPQLFVDRSFASSDAERALYAMMNLSASYGSKTQAGMDLLDAALAAAAPGGCNEGLLRPGAMLDVVSVAEGEDESSWLPIGYLGAWERVPADPTDLGVHGVSGPLDGSCTRARPSPQLDELTRRSGGEYLDICGAWAGPLVADGLGAGRLRRFFPLSTPAAPPSVRVEVDGLAAGGWGYDAGAAAIRFAPDAAPAPGAQIEVRYTPLADCGP